MEKPMTYAQARAYIQGEEFFDQYEYNRHHADRLYNAVLAAYESMPRDAESRLFVLQNLTWTAKHYARDDSPYMMCNPEAQKNIRALIAKMESEAAQISFGRV